jgi:hypothetical protein
MAATARRAALDEADNNDAGVTVCLVLLSSR